MIKPDDIIKLVEEFNLLKNQYTNSITLSMPIINHNVPDVFDFRCTNGTYDLNSYLTGIDKNGLVYNLIFGLMVIVTNFAELNLWNLNWHIRNTNRN